MTSDPSKVECFSSVLRLQHLVGALAPFSICFFTKRFFRQRDKAVMEEGKLWKNGHSTSCYIPHSAICISAMV